MHPVYPRKDTPSNILPVALAFQENKLYVASNLTSNPSILVIGSRKGTLLASVASELIVSPSGLCFLNGSFYISNSSNHTIVKVSDIEYVPRYQLVTGSSNESGDKVGVVSSATLHSPHSLETFGKTLFVCVCLKSFFSMLNYSTLITTVAHQNFPLIKGCRSLIMLLPFF